MAKVAEAAAPSPKRGKLPLLIGAAVVVMLIGGAAAAYFLGFLGSSGHAEAATQHAAAADEHGASEASHDAPQVQVSAMFVDMPDMLVNLQAQGVRPHFLKLRLSLEVADEPTAQTVRALMPRVLDAFQLYLRALTAEDLAGSGGMQRLKEDLGARGSLAVEPVRIHDVLIKEMLVQ